ncbi:hypothetical protein BDF14DRAFT_1121626 [Spinellus fusiger]|nr:hypothetical protein BDF14DRAFT_1121626 [Spinellus fusiger]
MSNYRSGDGGVGFLDFNAKDSIIKTQTIRIDSIPSFSRLFAASKKVSSVRTKQDIGKDYAAILEINNLKDIPTTLDKAMVLRQPIHFMKIDVEGFELKSLESASGLYEAGLVEHTVLEFGPPSRWDVTLESTTGMSVEEKRATTTAQAKRILLKAMREWHLDIYLLPAIGWESTVRWMLDHGVDYSQNISSTSQSKSNKVVYQLMAWDFDGMGMESDEFEDELKAKDQMVTEFIPLPENLLEAYLDDLESIGEMYLWFAKRGSKSPVLAKTTL